MMNFLNNQIDKQKFQQIAPQLTDNILQQLVQKAKEQGISDSDITAGLQFINKLR